MPEQEERMKGEDVDPLRPPEAEALTITNLVDAEPADMVHDIPRVVRWLEDALSEVELGGMSLGELAIFLAADAEASSRLADTFSLARHKLAYVENALRQRWLQLLTPEEREQMSDDDIAAILAGKPPQSREEQTPAEEGERQR